MRSKYSPDSLTIALRRETLVCAAFAVLASAYAVLFFAGRLTMAPPDADTGLRPRRAIVWLQALLPETIVQNWCGDGAPLGFVDRLPPAAAAFCVWLFAWSLGRLTLGLLKLDRQLTGLERFVLAAGCGANLLALYLLALGLAGRLTRTWLVAPLVLATLGAVGCEVLSALRRARAAPVAAPLGEAPQPNLPVTWRWWLPAIAFALAIAAAALLPSHDFDVLEYHLQAPKEFFQDGRISFLPHNVYANMPLGAEMLSLAAMVLSGDWWTGGVAGCAAIAGFAPLAALALLALGCRYGSPRAGAIAGLVYISIPWVATVSAGGLVEGAAAFYLIASLYAFALWRSQVALRRAGWGHLLLLGLLCGGAVAIKYPALPLVALPTAAAVVFVGRRPQRVEDWCVPENGASPQLPARFAFKALAVFTLGVAIACGPWLTKNLVLTGNPTYPLLYRWFDGLTRTAAKDAQWRRVHGPPNFSPRDFADRAAGFLLTSDLLSPVVLPLAALAFVRRDRRRLALALAGYVLFVLLVWWGASHRLDRFWVPVLPVVAMLAGLGATWSWRPAWRVILAIWLVVGLGYDFLMIGCGVAADSRYFVSQSVLRAEIERLPPAHAWLDAHVPVGSRVLLVGDAMPFGLRVPALYNTVFDSSVFEDLVRGRSPADVREALSARRIAMIYVDWAEIDRYRSPGNYGFTDFVEPKVFSRLVAAGVLERVYADERGEVYRVIAERTSRPRDG